jgi:hypothetical protein
MREADRRRLFYHKHGTGEKALKASQEERDAGAT